MDALLSNKQYTDDIRYVAELPLDWDKLAGKTIVVSGATGMIGSFLVDTLLWKNQTENLECTVYALGRSEEKARERFSSYFDRNDFRFICCDIGKFDKCHIEPADYILHLASNTHPLAYATDPIGTVTANVIGLYNLLEIAVRNKTTRFIFASSVEIYGENRGDTERFDEDYCGYIDSNTLRAGYPESKRCGEALCQAYIKQKDIDIVIPRLARTFGPTMLQSDTKAISQFIRKGVARENIILKSEGAQLYSYTYVADAVSGILYCCLKGERGAAYNIADKSCDISLRELAMAIANYAGTKVIFELPDAVEAAGYSKATKAILDSAKLQKLGWSAKYDLKSAISRTIEMLGYTNSQWQETL